jgi:hypothetical protein
MEIEWRLPTTRASSESVTEGGKRYAKDEATPTSQPAGSNHAAETANCKDQESLKKQEDSAKSTKAKTASVTAPSESLQENASVSKTHGASDEADKTSDRPADTAAQAKAPKLSSTPTPALQVADAKPTTLKRSAGEAFEPNYSDNKDVPKHLQFRLRKAHAKPDLATAKADEKAGEVGKNSVRYLQASQDEARAVLELVTVELELKEAEGGKKDEPEFRKLVRRKAEANLALVVAEETSLWAEWPRSHKDERSQWVSLLFTR